MIFTPVNDLLRSTHKYSSGGGMEFTYIYNIPDDEDIDKTVENFDERDVYTCVRLL